VPPNPATKRTEKASLRCAFLLLAGVPHQRVTHQKKPAGEEKSSTILQRKASLRAECTQYEAGQAFREAGVPHGLRWVEIHFTEVIRSP